MSAAVWPDHLLSLKDWEELPEDTSRRYELVEGVLHVSPRPVSDHQRALMKLGRQLDEQVPEELAVLPDIEVVLFESWPTTIRVPDISIVRAEIADENPARYRAADVLLAVEIISPGSVRTDRLVKLAEYADAGIPDYWIVDLGKPVSIAAYKLKNSHYVLAAESATAFSVDSPAELTLNPAALLPRR